MQENTTEIHLRHENDVLLSNAEPDKRHIGAIVSAVVGVEEGLLRELGGYLASEVSSQTVSMVGRELVGATKAELSNDDQGQPILKLNLDFDRAWASIGQALQNAEVEVTDLDRSTGIYFIDLPEKALTGEENSGFFKRLLGGRGGDVLAMQIRVTELSSGGYKVQALDADAEPAEPELARDVLNLIREFAV
jgi:outer membrane protein assembly factor BamC